MLYFEENDSKINVKLNTSNFCDYKSLIDSTNQCKKFNGSRNDQNYKFSD